MDYKQLQYLKNCIKPLLPICLDGCFTEAEQIGKLTCAVNQLINNDAYLKQIVDDLGGSIENTVTEILNGWKADGTLNNIVSGVLGKQVYAWDDIPAGLGTSTPFLLLSNVDGYFFDTPILCELTTASANSLGVAGTYFVRIAEDIEPINPLWWGGGDDEDCTAAFQKAIAYSDGLKPLKIPVGNFILSRALALPAGQQIFGSTPGTEYPVTNMGTVITNTTSNFFSLSTNNAAGNVFKNLCVRGSQGNYFLTAGNQNTIGLKILNCGFTNIQVFGAISTQALQFSGNMLQMANIGSIITCVDSVFSENIITGIPSSMSVVDINYLGYSRFTDNFITGATGYDTAPNYILSLHGGNSNNFKGNVFDYAKQYSLYINATKASLFKDNSFVGNTFRGFQTAIYLANYCRCCVFSENMFETPAISSFPTSKNIMHVGQENYFTQLINPQVEWYNDYTITNSSGSTYVSDPNRTGVSGTPLVVTTTDSFTSGEYKVFSFDIPNYIPDVSNAFTQVLARNASTTGAGAGSLTCCATVDVTAKKLYFTVFPTSDFTSGTVTLTAYLFTKESLT